MPDGKIEYEGPMKNHTAAFAEVKKVLVGRVSPPIMIVTFSFIEANAFPHLKAML